MFEWSPCGLVSEACGLVSETKQANQRVSTVVQPSRVGGSCVGFVISFSLPFFFGQALILSFEQCRFCTCVSVEGM